MSAQAATQALLIGNNPLLIASHNRGKVHEIAQMLGPLNVDVRCAADCNLAEPEETGASFADNATLKAEHASQATGFASLADDSGLVVPALDGAPGIYSARWAGPNKDFVMAMERIRTELNGQLNQPAYFVCMLALSIPNDQTYLFEGRVNGVLTFPPRGEKGFGYDPIFIPEGHSITFGEMDPDKKNAISHRAHAFERFTGFLGRSTA